MSRPQTYALPLPHPLANSASLQDPGHREQMQLACHLCKTPCSQLCGNTWPQCRISTLLQDSCPKSCLSAHRQGTHERLEWLVELGWMLMSLPEGCAPPGGSSGSSQLTRWVLSEALVGPSPEARITPWWRAVMRGARPELISLRRCQVVLGPTWAGVVVCCAVLCCAVLCCAVLCCAVLCCAVWQVLRCSWPRSLLERGGRDQEDRQRPKGALRSSTQTRQGATRGEVSRLRSRQCSLHFRELGC